MKNFVFLPMALAVIFPGVILAQMQQPATPDKATGIEGTISISPIQGGPTRVGSADSKPLANTTFEVKQGDRVITSFQTDAEGHFQKALKPGRYTVSRKDHQSAVGFFGPFEVVVSRDKMTTVDWKCDTGIR